MQARHCTRLAYFGVAGLLLAVGPAAALPVPVDAALVRAVAQQGVASEGARVIKVQGLKLPGGGGGGGGGGRGGGGGDLRIGGSGGGGGGGHRRGGRGGDGKRDYSLSRRGGRDHDGRRHRRYGSRYYYSLPFIFSYPYPYPYPYPYSYRYAYPSERCGYWHRRCVANWGYRNSNYYGCMRYYGC